jgi:hypothetical protein
LGERSPYKAEVAGSIPVPPTIKNKGLCIHCNLFFIGLYGYCIVGLSVRALSGVSTASYIMSRRQVRISESHRFFMKTINDIFL